jgi:hypothetical protein
MSIRFSCTALFFVLFLSQDVLGALPSSFTQQKPPSLTLESSNSQVKPVVLGQNSIARYGAWASLGFTALVSSYITYRTVAQGCDTVMLNVPLLKSYHADVAHAFSLLATVPISALSLMKLGPVFWYFFYILYAGERMSPVLARDALRDVQVYVQHLHVIKAIQQDLLVIINQINEVAMTTASGVNVQFPQEIPDHLKKAKTQALAIDPQVLEQLQLAIERDEDYVQVILQQLQPFLPEQELQEFQDDLQVKSATVVYAIAYELQDQAQAIIDVLKISAGQDMGSDAAILNHLIKDLIAYWQSYTQSLADGIDASVRFCNNVHLVEQVIVSWMDRALLCV